MTRAQLAATGLGVLVTASLAGAAPADLAPERSLVRASEIELLAMTGGSAAYVVGETARQCEHVELWQPETRRVQRFGKPTAIPCKEVPSTGSGVWELGLARTRLLWTTFVGGNIREWQLWTATPTAASPRQLRFVARDVDEPAPIAVGPGTAEGVPYAVDREVTYLGENGRAIFRWTSPRPIRAVTAGTGPDSWRVAALEDDGTVVVLDGAGRPAYDPSFQADAVRSIALAPAGLVVQMGDVVVISKPSLRHDVIRLQGGSRMVDVAQGRVLYRRGRDLWALTIATHAAARLVRGTPAHPIAGQLEPRGVTWAKGRRLFWRGGPLPR